MTQGRRRRTRSPPTPPPSTLRPPTHSEVPDSADRNDTCVPLTCAGKCNQMILDGCGGTLVCQCGFSQTCMNNECVTPPVCPADAGFTSTMPGVYPVPVPGGCSRALIEAIGASGGGNVDGGLGGGGSIVTVTISLQSVTSELVAFVGTEGMAACAGSCSSAPFTGGGVQGGLASGSPRGGTGGGSSEVDSNCASPTIDSAFLCGLRLVVAAGGGGAGSCAGGAGGAGGAPGVSGSKCGSGLGGEGATLTANGMGGAAVDGGTAGSAGTDMSGGASNGGGAGGGGYFSGGGGAIGPGNSDSNPLGGGGGGGTSWANPNVVSGSVTYTTNGFQSDGFVRITFE